MEELISVVVPVYNVEDYIHKCVDSIINQTYRNLEIILVDDGSSDNSGRICDEYAEIDERIKVIHKENGGLSDARNAGIEISKGDYLGFVDSDDYIDADMYCILMNNLKNADADISTCGRIIVTGDDSIPLCEKNTTACLNSYDAINDLFTRNKFVFHAAWDKLYKREMFSNIRFPIGRLFEDAAVMYQIFEKANKIVATEKQMYYYLQRQGSISNCLYNKNKVLHQFENRINAINYYKRYDKKKCTLAKVWNLRMIEPIWLEAYLNDKETAKFLISQTRRNFTAYVWKYAGIRQFIKSIIFCLNPVFYEKLKNSSIRSVKNNIFNFVKKTKQIVFGYFKNKKKYKDYDKKSIFICGIPEYGNLGDQAITIAEVNFISSCLTDSEIILIPEGEWYENLLCIKLITNKYHNICISPGGGNMGELYAVQENIRLSAVKNLKKAGIIIFPQSIDYLENSNASKKAKKIYESHKCLTIFTREEQSELLRKKLFETCDGDMVPDIALSYIPKIGEYERKGVIFCTRSDKEKNKNSQSALGELRETAKTVFESVKTVDTYSDEYRCKYEEQIHGLNKIWKEFKSAELVITDRLHGMIFCAITNTPCIALDNTTGKVGYLYRTWLENSNILFLSNQNELQNAIDIIKNRKFENPDIDFEELRKSYSSLIKALVE